MTKRRSIDPILKAWAQVPDAIEKAIEGLSEEDLDLRGGSEGWSIRETVHHLVEANLIASNILIAALSGSRRPYDWSWVNPSREWMERVGYDEAPVAPAVETLRALRRHISALVAAEPGRAARKVSLLDAPGEKPHATTVEGIIRQEVEHAKGHLKDVAGTRRRHSR